MLLFLMAIENEEDRSKLERIYEEYAGYMRRRANGILKNDDDAEDAVQDAFLKMIGHLDKLKDVSSFQTKWYVVTAAENAAIDIYRKKQRMKETELECYSMADGRLKPYEGRNEIVKTILKLSHKDRSILMQRYVYDCTYAEIGEMMDMTDEAVRKAVKRALDRLEKECKEEGIL